MRIFFLTLILLFSTSTLYSCGKKSPQDNLGKSMGPVEHFTDVEKGLTEISYLEKKLLHFKFKTEDLDFVVRITLTPDSDINYNNAQEAKDSLSYYAATLEQFLADFPESHYAIKQRGILEKKLELSREMIQQITDNMIVYTPS